ncbi:J domain-containing protein [Leptolyngbya sp. O-77]|uniref:J domain-containing protein n=1 Tax=Leptolyngbya sp. O-77 TaxID=1080068 RepID=UPI00074D37CC|nr:DnaJ domain-containing protein [Leptolyngbya sp. O-77]BAU43753.1 Chaperone protein DnaJ [Leptolyngbya sp. O-77]
MNLAECYRILGLRSSATYEEIKSSYRRLARRYHPDLNPGSAQQAEQFIQVNAAYRQLMELVRPTGMGDRPLPAPPRPAPSAADASPSTASPKATSPSSAQKAQTQRSPTAQSGSGIRKRPPIQRSPDASPTDHQLKEHVYSRLQQLLRQQRYPRAVALVEGLAQRLPNDLEVRQWLAIAYQRWGRHLVDLKQPEKARTYLNKALRTDPRNRALWFEVDRDLRRLDGIEIL